MENLTITGKILSNQLAEVVAEISKMEESREKYNKKLQLELLISKIDVDIENLTARYKENKRILDDIAANKTAIENNNKIEISLNLNSFHRLLKIQNTTM